MTTAIFEMNLAAMATRSPELARQYASMGAAAAGRVEVTPSKAGPLTAALRVPDGRKVQLHSRYDPIGEARAQVGKVEDTNLVVILGLGLGYALDAVHEQLEGSPLPYTLVVVEPDAEVFVAYLQTRDATRYLHMPSVYWFIGTDAVTFGNHWNRLLDWGRIDGFRIFEHPASLSVNEQYFREIKEKIVYIARRSKGNMVTIIGTVHEFERNCLRNLPYFAANPGIGRLFGKFSGVPAIVVAAGPSLEYVIPELKQAKGKFPIIAVDTAFRQLVERGVRPDIVCAADTSYLNALDFVGVENESEVVLAVETMVNSRIFKTFTGPKMIMDFGGNMLQWAKDHCEEKGIIECWGSISTTAFDLALKMDCSPIVMVGLDLSFEDGMLHARGSYSDDVHFNNVTHLSSLEHEISSYINKWGSHRLQGKRGIYRQWFEDRFKILDREVINSTVGGVTLKNTTDLPLADALQRFAGKEVDVAALVREAVQGEARFNVETMRGELKAMLRELSSMAELARRNLDLFKQLEKTMQPETRIDDLTGPQRTNWIQMTKDIDRVSANRVLYGWLSNHALKTITRYNSELLKLVKEQDNNLARHLRANRDFYAAVQHFTEVFLPLIRENIRVFESSAAAIRAAHQ